MMSIVQLSIIKPGFNDAKLANAPITFPIELNWFK